MSKPTNLLESALKELGLTDFESQLYQLLIKSKDLNVAKLAQKLGVYRLKIYDGIKRLESLDLLKKDEDSSKQIYLEPPSKILTNLKRKEIQISTLSQNLEEYLPQLQNEYYSNRRDPLVKIYEGKSQFLQIFHQVLDEMQSGQELKIIGEGQDFYNIIDFEYYYNTWRPARIAKQITSKVLWKTPVLGEVRQLLLSDKKEFRQSKILPNSLTTQGSVWITPNFIINWITVLPKAIVIQEQSIVKFYNEMFESLWNGVG